MRITYISSSTIPSRTANSIHVMKMCQAFQELGHDVELLAPARSGYSVHEEPIDVWTHYGVTKQFPIHWLKSSRRLREYDYALRAAFYARHRRPELVFARNVPAAAITGRLGIPTVCETHNLPGGPINRFSFSQLWHGSGFRRLVTISRPLLEKLTTYIPDAASAGKALVLPDGVDLDRFEQLPDSSSAKASLQLPTATLTLGYAGHLYPGRGIELILELAQNLRQYNFLIVGGDDEAVIKYRQTVKGLNLDNVFILGFVPNGELPQYLAACDILLMPYQRQVTVSGGGGNTVEWMSPLKMFEYMATGRLIISSDLPVLREVLNETNAVLCPPDNIGIWVQAIEQAAREPEWRDRIGQQALSDVNQYSWRKRAQQILVEAAITKNPS